MTEDSDELTVLVHDDELATTERFVEKLRDVFKRAGVETRVLAFHEVGENAFVEAFRVLRDRQLALRNDQSVSEDATLFDEADVFVIDFDLAEQEEETHILTGEELSYYVRAFSDCGLILSVNQVIEPTFDLTLQEEERKWADLLISEEELDMRGLWVAHGWRMYRPWNWPCMPVHARNFDRMVREVEGNLGETIVDYFEFPKGVRRTIPRDMVDFFRHPAEFQELTFRDVAQARLRPKDAGLPSRWLARIAAATVSRWFLTVVLPGQNILVDAPHLVSRYPSLLGDDPDDRPPRNKTPYKETCRLDGGIPDSLHSERIDDAFFEYSHWLSRPVWWTSVVSENQELPEVTRAFRVAPCPYVFAEDASNFFSEDECRSFRIPHETPHKRRYVRQPDDSVRYEPGSRLARGSPGPG